MQIFLILFAQNELKKGKSKDGAGYFLAKWTKRFVNFSE